MKFRHVIAILQSNWLANPGQAAEAGYMHFTRPSLPVVGGVWHVKLEAQCMYYSKEIQCIQEGDSVYAHVLYQGGSM